MKRSLCVLIVIVAFLLSGCSFPVQNSSSDALNKEVTKDLLKKNPIVNDSAAKETTTKGLTSRETTREATTVNNTNNNLKVPTQNDKTGSIQVASKTDSRENVREVQGISSTSTTFIVLYYQDANKNIIPVTRRFEKQTGIAKAAVGGLIDHPITREELEYYGIYPVLPLDTKVLGINIKDGNAVIDFNNKLLNYKDDVAERNIVSSIIYTLTEFKSINNVKILIEGHAQKKLKYGTDISGDLNRGNVLINSGKINLDQSMSKLDLYLYRHIDARNSYTLPVSIELSKPKEEELPGKVIELLTKDYSNKKLSTELPQKVKLLGSSLKAGTLTLNFNSEIRNYGGTAREDAILKQILHSIKQIKGVERIKILIEGKEGTLPEGTEISKELIIPGEINTIVE